jgi:NCS2 family nucleobase:cation symporter-2
MRPRLRLADLPDVAGLVLATILLINRFMRGFWVNVSVLIGMAWATSSPAPSAWSTCPAWPRRPGCVTPLHFGMPTFSLAPILSMCLVVVIIFVESTGMFLALGKITDRKLPTHAASRPAVRRRGIVHRRVLQHLHPLLVRPEHRPGADDRRALPLGHHVAGGLLIVLSLLPKAAFLVASIPPAVLGGAPLRCSAWSPPPGSRSSRKPTSPTVATSCWWRSASAWA